MKPISFLIIAAMLIAFVPEYSAAFPGDPSMASLSTANPPMAVPPTGNPATVKCLDGTVQRKGCCPEDQKRSDIIMVSYGNGIKGDACTGSGVV